jgi:competence protein ComEC
MELPLNSEKDFASYLKSNGFTAIFEGYSKDLVVVKKVHPLSIIALSNKMKASIVMINERLLFWPQSEFLTALITGRRDRLPREIIENFRKSGTMHILAVSGLHIGFLVLFFVLIFKMLRVNQYLSSILLFVIVLFYMIFIGDAPSVKRASLMVMCGILIFLFDRDRDYLNVLSLAFNILWIANPLIILNPGFILSFSATFAILFLVPAFLKIFGKVLPPFLAASLSVSLGIQIYLLPVMLSFFGTFSYINIVANLPIVPLAGLALALEMLTLFVYPLFIPMAIIFAEVNLVVVTTILRLARFFSNVAPLRVAYFPQYMIPPYFVIVTVVILMLFKREPAYEENC